MSTKDVRKALEFTAGSKCNQSLDGIPSPKIPFVTQIVIWRMLCLLYYAHSYRVQQSRAIVLEREFPSAINSYSIEPLSVLQSKLEFEW